jgi:probable HAF family extracellular repeat protein
MLVPGCGGSGGSSVTAVPAYYKFTDLGSLGGPAATYVTAASNTGKYTGYALLSSGETRAFISDGVTFQVLPGPQGNTPATGNSINDTGQIVGGSSRVSVLLGEFAFFYSQGAITDLSILFGLSASSATGINNHGDIVGTFSTSSGAHAFLIQNSALIDLTPISSAGIAWAINDKGQVLVGSNIWQDGRLTSLGHGANPVAISNSGTVAGNFSLQGRAFMWKDGHLSDLGTLANGETSARSVNDSDIVVGRSALSNSLFHAFRYSNGKIEDLNRLMLGRNQPSLVDALHIDNTGRILAYSQSTPGSTYHYYLLVPQ